MASTMLLDMPVSPPLPLSTSLAWPLLLSLLSEDFTLELDVMLLTLLEPFMLPRGRLRLMPSMELDMVLDTLVWDTLDLDTPVSDTLVSDTPVLDTMLLLDTLTSLPLVLSTSLAWPLLLSLLLEDFMLELDVMLLTLLEPSMLPRGRLILTTLLDTVLDMLVLDTLVSDTLDLDMVSTMLLDMPVSLPLPLSTSLAWPLLLSLLSEDFTLELDVMLLTLLEPSMSPRGRLILTTLLDTVLDMLVSDTPVSDTLDLDMASTMLLDMPVSLPLPL